MLHSAKMDTPALLAKLIRLSNSNTQFEFKVTNFLNIISWELDLEYAVLLTLDGDYEELQPFWLADSTLPRLGPVSISGNIIGRCLSGRQTLLADQDDLLGLPHDWAAFTAPFNAGLMVTPLVDDKTGYGVLLLLSRTFKALDHNQSLLLEAVANELTIAIKNGKLVTDIRKRLTVLNVLSVLGRTLSSTIDVEKVMAMIPQIASGIFLADGCTVNILDEDGRRLVLSSQYGLIPPAYNFERYHSARNLPASVSALLSRQASFSGYLKEDPHALDLSDSEMTDTIISCPLIFQGPHKGSISLFNKLGGQGTHPDIPPRLFDRDDLELLFSMNNMISGVLENAITFREVEILAQTNEKIISYLSILYEISSAMMTTVRYDELVWIITRALTDRRGLGFDQVFILLLEEGEEGRHPTLVSSSFWTCGQSSEESAPEQTLAEFLKTPSKEEAALMLQSGEDIRVRIPVFPENPRLLSRVLMEKKAMLGFRSFDAEQDERLKDFGLKAYAAVPMVAKNRDVGVIAVDRSSSGGALTLSDLRDLTMLANQAGLAIENTRLYDDLEKANRTLSQVQGRLIEAEKNAAQGEMGAQLAHEVRNPLVSIGGFTQRLLKKMAAEDPLRKYAEVIWEEVSRVNRVLNNILNYSRNVEGLMREFPLEVKVAEAIGTLKHEMERLKITMDMSAAPNLPLVSADDSQVMHIVLNIIYNASQAMGPKGGRIHIRLFETLADDESYVACEITDTGPGIPEAILPNIFTPFYTSKADGTGLGLSIVKKIVDRYHGRIQAANHPAHIPDSGASFIFMFPSVQSDAFNISSSGQE